MGGYDATHTTPEDVDVNTPNQRPATRIETERLVIRCREESDAPQVRASLDASDAHLRPWVPFMKQEPQSVDGTRQDSMIWTLAP